MHCVIFNCSKNEFMFLNQTTSTEQKTVNQLPVSTEFCWLFSLIPYKTSSVLCQYFHFSSSFPKSSLITFQSVKYCVWGSLITVIHCTPICSDTASSNVDCFGRKCSNPRILFPTRHLHLLFAPSRKIPPQNSWPSNAKKSTKAFVKIS